jgi:hypothetical protein
MADEVVEAQAGAQAGNGAHGRLNWTSGMSSFVLRRFTELVGEGVKTDKGFKDVHLNRVAKDLSEWGNMEVSGSQVYNHLRKWRARWVKISKLKNLSGALWDEDLFMITLAPDHYSGHVKVYMCSYICVFICVFILVRNLMSSTIVPCRTTPKMQSS